MHITQNRIEVRIRKVTHIRSGGNIDKYHAAITVYHEDAEFLRLDLADELTHEDALLSLNHFNFATLDKLPVVLR